MSDSEDLLKQAAALSSRTQAGRAQAASPSTPADFGLSADGIPPKLLESFCLDLSRLIQGQQLYSEGNDLLSQMWERQEKNWAMIRAYDEEVTLQVKRGALEFKGEVIFEQEGRDNIAVILHRDGVRSISFKPDTPRAEFAAFLTVFEPGTKRWQEETDSVDRMWMLELDYITYTAMDAFEEMVQETGGEILKDFGKGIDLLTGVGDDGITFEEEIAEVDLDEIFDLQEELESTLLPAPRDFWTHEGPDAIPNIFEHFHRIMRYLCSVPQPPIGLRDLEVLCERMFSEQLKLDDHNMVTRIEASLQQPAPAGERLQIGWESAATLERFTELLALEDSASPRVEALTKLLEGHVHASPTDLAARAAQATSPAAALPLVRMVHEMDPDPLALWVPHAASLSHEAVTEILFTVTENEVMGPSGRTLLATIWERDDDPDVFRAVIDATPQQLLGEYRDLLHKRLESDDPFTRVVASEGTRRLRDPRSGIYVLNAIRRADPKALSEPELESLLRTLMAIGRDRYLDFMGKCLGPIITGEGGFFGRKRAIKSYVNPYGDKPVLLAIARHGSEDAWKMIKRFGSKTEDEGIKRYIGELRKDWEGQPPGDPDLRKTWRPPRQRPQRRAFTPYTPPKPRKRRPAPAPMASPALSSSAAQGRASSGTFAARGGSTSPGLPQRGRPAPARVAPAGRPAPARVAPAGRPAPARVAPAGRPAPARVASATPPPSNDVFVLTEDHAAPAAPAAEPGVFVLTEDHAAPAAPAAEPGVFVLTEDHATPAAPAAEPGVFVLTEDHATTAAPPSNDVFVLTEDHAAPAAPAAEPGVFVLTEDHATPAAEADVFVLTDSTQDEDIDFAVEFGDDDDDPIATAAPAPSPAIAAPSDDAFDMSVSFEDDEDDFAVEFDDPAPAPAPQPAPTPQHRAHNPPPPAHNTRPSAHGAQPPVRGAQPPVRGGQPPVRGGRPPARGARPPVRRDVPPGQRPAPNPAAHNRRPPVRRDGPPGQRPPVRRDAPPGQRPPVRRDVPPGQRPPVRRDGPPGASSGNPGSPPTKPRPNAVRGAQPNAIRGAQPNTIRGAQPSAVRGAQPRPQRPPVRRDAPPGQRPNPRHPQGDGQAARPRYRPPAQRPSGPPRGATPSPPKPSPKPQPPSNTLETPDDIAKLLAQYVDDDE